MLSPDELTFINYMKSKALALKNRPVISQILKIERARRKMTLEQAADGVCSVSYLSKLENHNVEGLNSGYVRMLCEKYEIDYNTINTTADVDTVLVCLNHYYNDDYTSIEKVYKSIPNVTFTSPQALISCIYFITINDYKSFLDEVKNIEAIKFTLTDVECVIYLYLLSLYNMKVSNYEQAYEYLKEVVQIKHDENILKVLILEALIFTSLHLGRDATLITSYHELEKSMPLNYPDEKRVLMKLVYDTCICLEYPEVVTSDIKDIRLDNYHIGYQRHILYYMYVSRIKLALDKSDLNRIFEEIIACKFFNSKKYLGLASYLAIKLNGRYYYRVVEGSLKENEVYVNDNEDMNIIFTKFIMKYASYGTDADVIDYMRQNIIPVLKTKQHFLYSKELIDKFCELLAIDGKYRDAYLYSFGQKKDLKQIQERIHVIKA